MSVRRAQAEIDSAEFAEWLAYARLEPYGPERSDLRAGIVAATYANAHRARGQRPYAASDFMPQFGRPQGSRQSPQEMAALFKQYVQVHNGSQHGHNR